jgi:hypothetical protein
MKVHFNRAQIASVMVAGGLLMSLTAPAYARDGDTAHTAATAAFCSRLGTLQTQTTNAVTERVAKLGTTRTDGDAQHRSRREGVDDKLVTARAKADAERKLHYAKLGDKATTDAQKQALEEFKSTIEPAVATRRAAVDAADTAYRSGVDQLIARHRTSIDSAVASFKTGVNAAFAQAQVGCAAGTSADQIRTTLVASLKTARTTLQTSLQNADKVKGNVAPLDATRKQAVNAAVASFKTTARSAGETLKAALKQQ